MHVLILRPSPGNEATAARVAALGCTPVCVPLFEIAPVVWTPPDPSGFDSVVMTSANAARYAGAALKLYAHLPLYAVGTATADAVRAAGFGRVTAGTADAAALGPRLEGRVLHFAGADHRPIPTGAAVTTLVVYRADASAVDQIPSANVALVHSPRAGARLAALIPERQAVALVAISPAAAAAAGTGWGATQIADAPHEAAMLECLAKLCEAGAKSQQGFAP